MRYDASRVALYSPQKRDPLPASLFVGRGDALCAELARLAYYRFENDSKRLEATLTLHGLAHFASFVDQSVNSQVFACRGDDGTAWIAFRGTQSDAIKDLIMDGKAWHSEWHGPGRVHTGFAEAYCGQQPGTGVSVREQLAEWILRAQPEKLVLTGHSLGAALATLCAIDYPRAELVTFGSPRVGDAQFCAAFAGRIVRRYQDCTDIVTRVPPAALDYDHVGELNYIDRLGDITREPSTKATRVDVSAAIWEYLRRHAWRWGNVLVRDLADHAPINYVSALLGMREPH